MTSEEAIKILSRYDNEYYTPATRKAHRMAVDALREQEERQRTERNEGRNLIMGDKGVAIDHNKLQYIIDCLPAEELLCQLAEEASELAKAALKLRRCYGTINPTPIPKEDGLKNLYEEIADVWLILKALGMDEWTDKYQEIMAQKTDRWAKRLDWGGLTMTDREKLIELLENDDCPLLYVLGENVGALADHLIANGVRLESSLEKKQATSEESERWIPVTERLPHEDLPFGALCEVVQVLLQDGRVSVGWCNRGLKCWYYLPINDTRFVGHGYELTPVVAWKPLSDAPDEYDRDSGLVEEE